MEIISTSVSGYWADATQLPVDASTTETFIDDVPKSIPNNNIVKQVANLSYR
jgi:hypothetical protein